jgi:Zn finger protein HypA/HybF involved in hydrogenase expression
MATTAYCVKCKKKQEMKDEKEIQMKGKSGVKRRALTGVCPVCGTKMFRILGKA